MSIFRWNFKKRSENARFAVSRNLLFHYIRCRGSRLHVSLRYEPRKLFETKLLEVSQEKYKIYNWSKKLIHFLPQENVQNADNM